MTKTHISLLLSSALFSTLGASPLALDKITVTTPTKSSQSLQNTTANVTLITAKEIEERGYHTISDVLRTVPGISYTRNGGLGHATSIMLRGFDSKRVLVLIDGVRYNNPTSLSGAEFEHIMIDNIARIEVVKGAQSGVWGADASAGIINIITKKAELNGLNTTLFGEYGSYNSLKYGFNANYKQEQFDATLNASRLTTDGFSAKVPVGANPNDFEDDSYENSTVDLKLGANVTDKDRVEGFFNYIDAKSDFDGFNSNPILAANDANSTQNSKEQFYGLSYTRSEGENRLKLYANRSKFEREYPNAFVKNYDGSVDEIGLNTAITYMNNGALSAGIDQKTFHHDNKIAKSYDNQGIFLTNTNTFSYEETGETTLTQALRYDKFEAFDNKLTYKLGVKQSFKGLEDFWLSANYATAYNVPTLYQLYGDYGNKDLNPEETKGFDVSMGYKGFGVSYFNNSIDDMIDYVTTDFKTFAGAYYNVAGKSKLSGVELSYADSIEAMDVAYGVNYTYLKAEDKEGKALPRRAKNNANATLDYYGLANTHLGTQISYVGSREKSLYDVGTQTKDEAYTLVDVIADYTFAKSLNLYLKVDNLLDKRYENIAGYATAQRSFYAGFRYNIQ